MRHLWVLWEGLSVPAFSPSQVTDRVCQQTQFVLQKNKNQACVHQTPRSNWIYSWRVQAWTTCLQWWCPKDMSRDNRCILTLDKTWAFLCGIEYLGINMGTCLGRLDKKEKSRQETRKLIIFFFWILTMCLGDNVKRKEQRRWTWCQRGCRRTMSWSSSYIMIFILKRQIAIVEDKKTGTYLSIFFNVSQLQVLCGLLETANLHWS